MRQEHSRLAKEITLLRAKQKKQAASKRSANDKKKVDGDEEMKNLKLELEMMRQENHKLSRQKKQLI